MKRFLFLLLAPASAAHAAEHDHSAHAPEAPAEPVMTDHGAHASLMAEHGGSLNYLVLGERLEQTDASSRLWELQGWLGYDYDRLWLKVEGEYDTKTGVTERSEVQALYSRAVAPYWDLQAGLRRDDRSAEARTYAVIGLMGLAPYWFEVDAAAFISEHGDVSMRVEAEYELRFTQKLFLQPRLELDYGFTDDPRMRIGEGLSEAGFGLRLRYEVLREFAPYVGVEWVRAHGDTATLLRMAGERREEVRGLAGFRFWY